MIAALLCLAALGQNAGGAVLDNLERRAREALAAIRHARTPAEADAARPRLRQELERSLGWRRLGWPPGLRARTVGSVERPGYRIEKVVFQTFPGTLVPAHLYLPAALRGRAPAVLFYTGHWWPDSKARPDFQAFCINMARFGFAVLAFDAFGQGERGISTRDHRRTEGLLVGVAQQGFAEYETRCALEYLLSRKEVDPRRLGMTGASGGGYNTWITAALDDRIRVAVPVVGTSEFFEQIHVTRPLDWYQANEHCHFVPGLIRFANNHEFVAMAAPRPLLIVSASQDQSFPVNGVRQIAGYARELYGAYGVPEKFGYYEDSTTGHGYQQKKREAAYGWFLRWLMERGDGRPFPEPATSTEPPDSPELRCFSAGENQPAGPGMMAAVRMLAADARATRALLEPVPPARQFDTPLAGRVEIPAEPEFAVPAILKRGNAGVLVAAGDAGKEQVLEDDYVRGLVAQGWTVCALDPRGIGELKVDKPGWAFAVSLLLGENFVWRQGMDLANAVRALRGAWPSAEVRLYARGPNAALAASYALAQLPRGTVRSVRLEDGFTSLRQFLEAPEESYALKKEGENFRGQVYGREIPHWFVPFDGLSAPDLPEIWKTSGAEVHVSF